MRKFLSQFIFTRSFAEHTVSFLGILLIVYLGKEFLVFFLTAFLCASLFGNSSRYVHLFVAKRKNNIPESIRFLIVKITGEKTLLSILYIFFALLCIYIFSDIGPTLITDIAQLLQDFSQKFGIDLGSFGLQSTLGQWQNISTQISDFINVISPTTDTKEIVAKVIHIGSIFFQIIFGYIVSFVWLLENNTAKTYLSQLKQGPFAFFYNDLRIIFRKITHSFGLVFYAQFKIAVVNTILTVLGLVIIGFFYGLLSLDGGTTFPYLLALGFITFLTSFVPILGVFISGIPILFAGVVAYPGWGIIITILSMLLIIHVIESYILNPRIVGQSLNIPAPIIFIILFVSEHFVGIGGFFLGVPLYILLLEFITGAGKAIEKYIHQQKIV
ncbi:MAG: AI-2E family transporter [Candidatus Gracilibacteria bacterium]